MNKTIVIAGGSAVVSLAAGAAGGYFYARNKLGKEFDERLKDETEATEKYFSVLLMEARSEKPSIEELAERQKGEASEEEEEERTEEDLALEKNANSALTDYRGLSKAAQDDSDDESSSVLTNIFERDHKRAKFPPREPGTGRFTKQRGGEPQDEIVSAPVLITEDEFLENTPEYTQENLKYFKHHKTLLGYDTDAPIEIEYIGEENLTKFDWDIPPGEDNIIFVRNFAREEDYEIHLSYEDLTEYTGLDNTNLPPDAFV